MLKNKILFFFGTFLISFMVIYSGSYYQETMEKEKQIRDISVLLDDFQSKFEDFIEILLSKGIVTSEYFNSEIEHEEKYESLVAATVQGLDELYGMNLLDKNGRIIRVYPFETNKASLGKITQNIVQIKKSVADDEEFWLSPPFNLYQGPQGFVLYIPIRKNMELKGWIAPVIALEGFFSKLIISDFFSSYHLIIKDIASGKNYFETEKIPNGQKDLIIRDAFIRGRKISFISWPKKSLANLKHLPLSLSLALLISLIGSYLLIFFEQKTKVNIQAEEVNQLLSQSIQDANNSFTVLLNQMELLKMGMGHITIERLMQNTTYLSTLMEQIKTLQKISNQEESLRLEGIRVSEVLPDIMSQLQETLRAKQVELHIKYQDFLGVEVLVNKWLFVHSVLYPLIINGIQSCPVGTTLELTCSRQKYFYHITLKVLTNSESGLSAKVTNGIKKVMFMMNGDLIVGNEQDNQISCLLIIPAIS